MKIMLPRAVKTTIATRWRSASCAGCARRPLPSRPRQLSRRAGKREQVQEHLATATTMYREMDMRFWLERAEAELTQASG